MNDRLNRLDIARLLSALAVWAFHFGVLNYGYLGVEVFFGISGYVIAASASGRPFWQFSVARAARLYPAFLLCLILTSLAVTPSPTLAQFGANLTMIPRVLRQAQVDGVYWSLMFEILFYAYVAAGLSGLSDSVFERRLARVVPAWLLLCTFNLCHPLPGRILLILDWGPYFCTGCSAYLMTRGHSWGRPLWLASSLIAAWAAAAQTRFDPLVAGGVVLAISLGFPLLTVPTKSSRLVLLGAGLSYPIYLLSHKFGNVVQAASGSVIIAILVVLAMAYLVTLAEPSGKAWIRRIGNILGARLGFTRCA